MQKKTLEELQAMPLEERLQAILAEDPDPEVEFIRPNWPPPSSSSASEAGSSRALAGPRDPNAKR
jgi:hypothetical protein